MTVARAGKPSLNPARAAYLLQEVGYVASQFYPEGGQPTRCFVKDTCSGERMVVLSESGFLVREKLPDGGWQLTYGPLEFHRASVGDLIG